MATAEEERDKLDVRGPDDGAERVRVENLGGESGTPGAPVIISSGLLMDPIEHHYALRENPPQASIPAQDPTPLDDAEEGVVPVGRADQYPPQGGPGAVRRVHDRTPDSVLASSARPYNADASVVQRGKLTGQDAAEETAEGKHAEGGAAAYVKAQGEEEEAAVEERREEAPTRPTRNRTPPATTGG